MTGKTYLGARGRRAFLAMVAVAGLQITPLSGPLAVFGLGAPAARADDAAPVVLEHLSFRQGPNTIEIPRIEARGTALTATAFHEILDPSSALTPAQRLARLSAAAIAAPEITVRGDADASGDPRGAVVTFHDLLLSDVSAGKAATLSIRAIDGTSRPGKADAETFSLGSVFARAVDPTLALAIATDKRTDRNLPVSPIYRDLTVSGFRAQDTTGGITTIDRVDSGALEGRPLLETASDLATMSEQFSSAAPTGDKTRFYDALLDATKSFKLEHLQVSGIAFAEKGGQPVGIKIRNVLLKGVESLKIARFEVDEAALDTDDVHLSMARMALLNVDQSARTGTLLARLMGGMPEAGSPPPAEAQAGTELKVEDIHMVIPTPATGGPFPPGTVNAMDVPVIEFGVNVAPDTSTVETHALMQFRYDIPSGGSDPSIQSLRDAGLSRIDVSFRYKFGYDAAARAVRLDDFTVDGKDIGSVSVAGHLANMPQTLFDQTGTPDETVAALADARFHDVKLTIVDRGLLKRAMPIMARSGGTSEALMRAGLKTQVDLQLPQILGSTPAEAAVARAIDSFLDDPGTLVLSVRAPDGLAFGDVAAVDDPVALARRLDITAEAHR